MARRVKIDQTFAWIIAVLLGTIFMSIIWVLTTSFFPVQKISVESVEELEILQEAADHPMR